eukprot:sb/3465430/
MANLVDDLGQEMLYLPGTASLVQDIDKRVMVVLRDGRTLIGFLRSLDQFANLLLTQTIERIHVRDMYGDIDRGVFLVRGENVLLCGETDFQKPGFEKLKQVSQEEILKIQAEELKEKEERQKLLKKAFQDRGMPYYNCQDMAKKSKVDKSRERKKEIGAKKTNPFEVHHKKKKKHHVLGVKDSKVAGMPGVSRSKALEKRQKTLGQEYRKRNKKSTFVDGRFGEGNTELSVEDKMLARFTVERQKHHSKQRFNLDENEEDVLTHKGQNIDEIEDFDDVYRSDDEEEADKGAARTDMHFGGFLTKSEDNKHMSGKDFMEELVAQSKMKKLTRQRENDAMLEETTGLDNDWKELQGILVHNMPPAPTKAKDDSDSNSSHVSELNKVTPGPRPPIYNV